MPPQTRNQQASIQRHSQPQKQQQTTTSSGRSKTSTLADDKISSSPPADQQQQQQQKQQVAIDSFKLKGLQCDRLTLIDANTLQPPLTTTITKATKSSEPQQQQQQQQQLTDSGPPLEGKTKSNATLSLFEDSRFILKPTSVVVKEENNNTIHLRPTALLSSPLKPATSSSPIGLLATLRMETSQLHQRQQERKQTASNGPSNTSSPPTTTSNISMAAIEQQQQKAMDSNVSSRTMTTGGNYQSIPSYTSIFKPQHPPNTAAAATATAPTTTSTTTTHVSDISSYQSKQQTIVRVPLKKQTNLDSIGRKPSSGFSAKNLRDSSRNNRNNHVNNDYTNDQDDEGEEDEDDDNDENDDDMEDEEDDDEDEEQDLDEVDEDDDLICEDDDLETDERLPFKQSNYNNNNNNHKKTSKDNNNLFMFSNNNNNNNRQKHQKRPNELNNNKRLISMNNGSNKSSSTAYPGNATRQHLNQAKSNPALANVARGDKKTYKSSSPSLNSINNHNHNNHNKRATPGNANKISFSEISRPPSFNTCQQSVGSRDCRKLDLLEQVACLNCNCNNCLKKRKLAALNDNNANNTGLGFHGGKVNGAAGYNLQSMNANAYGPPLPPAGLNLNQFGYGCGTKEHHLHKAHAEKTYPKTRIMHLILKSIILLLCTMLLMLLLFGILMMSLHLPNSFDKLINATRQFNVTIAGRR